MNKLEFRFISRGFSLSCGDSRIRSDIRKEIRKEIRMDIRMDIREDAHLKRFV